MCSQCRFESEGFMKFASFTSKSGPKKRLLRKKVVDFDEKPAEGQDNENQTPAGDAIHKESTEAKEATHSNDAH